MFRLTTLGEVDLRDANERQIDAVLAEPRLLSLVAYLATAHQATGRRASELQALFWPQLERAAAQAALAEHLRRLREALVAAALVERGCDWVALDPSVLHCDATAFREAAEAKRFSDAASLYHGDFLATLPTAGMGGVAEWVAQERATLHRLASACVRQLVEEQEALGRTTQALAWGHRLVELEPYDERAVRDALMAHERVGDRAGAMHLYHEFARRLAEEYGSDPSPETRAVYAHLRSSSYASPPGVAVSPAPSRRGEPDIDRPTTLGGEEVAAFAQRYRIEREIGAGGMAIVYLAHDLKHHDREVAIKELRAEIAAGLARERFYQEIRIAEMLQHPNIVPLYDSGEVDGRLYFVMPYIRGPTLRIHLGQRGQLTVPEAVHLMRELTDALVYAHEAGVIHRDIKPENVMLIGGRAVLADFGIARAVHAGRLGTDGQTLTQLGIRVGTPAYMAPEQAAGSSAVDHRADLYALGVVAYEMLVGRPPFSSDVAEEVLSAQVAAPPPPISELRRDVPLDLAALIMQCLEKAPENRPSSAVEMSRLLESLVPPQEAPPPPSRSRWANWMSRRGARGDGGRPIAVRRLAAASTAVLLITLPLVPTVRQALGTLVNGPSAAAPRYLGVLSFKSADSADATLTSGLTQSYTHLLAALLNRAGSFWVLTYDDMLQVGADSPAELRKTYPVELVVTGELQRAGSKWSLRTELFDARGGTPELINSISVPDPSDSLSVTFVEALVGEVLNLSALVPSDAGTPAVSMASPARRSYVLGAGFMQRAYDLNSLLAAIENFQSAIAQDASFGPAYAGLCEALWERYLQTGQATFAKDASRMCERASELARSDPAALVALGRTQYFQGDLRRAQQTLANAIQQNAGADGHRWLGHVLEDLGRFDAAEREQRQAIALRPDVWIYHAALGQLLMNIERHQEAIESHREVIRLSPDNYIGYSNMGASLMLTHRLDEAEGQLRRSIQMRPTSLAYRNLGYLGLLRQRYGEALGALRDATSYGPEDWWSWRWLAHAQHWSGERAEAGAAWQRVVDLLRFRLDLSPTNQDMQCGMAEALIGLGDTKQSLLYLKRLTSRPIIKAYNLYWAGRAYELLGRRTEALQYVTLALARGFDPHTVASDPWLHALRTDPEYHGPREE